MTSRKQRETGNAIGFGGKPGKVPPRLKPEPRTSAAPGEPAFWDDLQSQWESPL